MPPVIGIKAAAAIARDATVLAAAIAAAATKEPKLITSSTAPDISVRFHGLRWFEDTTGIVWMWIVDVDSAQWVEVGPGEPNAPLATEAEARAGLNNTKTMTPFDTAAAIDEQINLNGLSAFVTLTDAATITWAAVAGVAQQNARVTLGGNRVLAITGLASGMAGTLEVTQDGTGSRTLTLPANSRVAGGGGGAVTLTATAGAVDKLSWCYDGAYLYFDAPKLNYTPGTVIPTLVSATIDPTGLILTTVFSVAVDVSDSDNASMVLNPTGADVTLDYTSGSGTTSIAWAISRPILQTSMESATLLHTQAGNGIEATVGGGDLATFPSPVTVANTSTQTGSSPSWVDTIDSASTTNDDDSSGYPHLTAAIVAPMGGNCTKLRVYIGDMVFGLGVKMALYDSATRARLNQGTTSVSASNGWVECTIPSTPVTLSTSYKIGFVAESTVGGKARYAGGTGEVDFTSGTYALADPFPTAGVTAIGRTYAAGMYIEP